MGIELERYESSLEAIKIALENEEIDTNGTNIALLTKEIIKSFARVIWSTIPCECGKAQTVFLRATVL